MIIAACIEYCLDRTASGGIIELECRRREEGIAILCAGNPELAAASETEGRLTHLELPYSELRDELIFMHNQNSPNLELRLPFHFNPRI